MPSENSNGHQTWNPSVGLYFKSKPKAESYGGVIRALQDSIDENDSLVKAYPENYAGIIAAIQDLTFAQDKPGSSTGSLPPGDSIDNTDPANPIYTPGAHKPGELWFDTRQGRLFTYTDEWVQANGADGLPVLLDRPPTGDAVVPGQLWWHTIEEVLYIFNGGWISESGAAVASDEVSEGDTRVWAPLGVGTDVSQTTATLPLCMVMSNATANYIQATDMTGLSNQCDMNAWVYQALVDVDAAVALIPEITVNATAPSGPQNGQLWYDTNALQMKVWDGTEWVLANPASDFTPAIQALADTVEQQRISRNTEVLSLTARVDQLDRIDDNKLTELLQDIAAVDIRVDNLPTYDLAPYALTASVNTDLATASGRIDALEAATTTLSSYQTKADAATDVAALNTAIDAKATPAQLNAAIAQIPDVSTFVTQSDIDTSVSDITANFIPRSGGTIDGQFVINKSDINQPAFDVSSSWYNSKDLLKLKSYSNDNLTATFGATDQYWEYAWNFTSHEDFAWVHSGNKVFSIAESGAACTDLYLTEFLQNTTNGRVLRNRVNVREKLAKHDTEITAIKSNITALTTTGDHGSKKIYYGDVAPTEPILNGDLWFDSSTLRLYVKHGGDWIYPDRVEDNSLKTALLNAVIFSTDYESLKSNLITAITGSPELDIEFDD